MSSSVSSLTSALAPAFTGVSKFGGSLRQVLTRAIGIASLPLDTLNNGLNALNNKQTALTSLDSAFSSLQRSVASLQHALDTTLLSSTVSDGSVVSATVGSGAAAGSYSIEVTNHGAFSTALSVAGSSEVANPATQGLGSTSPLTLSTGGSDISITPDSGSLQDLAAAINSQAGTSVQATLVNTGSSSAPNYRLSLRATHLGSGSITLTDASSTNLIATSTAGSLAAYKVAGLSTAITSDTRTVTLAPGLSVHLLSQSAVGVPATVTVSDSPDGLASAFSSFAQSYNSAASIISQNHGENAGALRGDSLLQALSGVLHKLATYDNGTPASALANYGITVDKTGKLSVDSAAFSAAANRDFPALLTALGTTTTGGFLKSATDALGAVEDPIVGLITTQTASNTAATTAQQIKISNEQALINSLETSLTSRIAKADAAIAALESRVSYVTGIFAQYTGATNSQSNGLSTL